MGFQSAPKADKRGSDVHLGVSEHGEGGGEGLVLQQEAEGEAPEPELVPLRHGQLLLPPPLLLLPFLPSFPGDASLHLWGPSLPHVVPDVSHVVPDVSQHRVQTRGVWKYCCGNGSV